ncbi:MAG: SagB/ThcOx family dehydrogenase [Chloroflexi bacterium]|nr:SagB/ThcOx family dehydrogenase [Chloroflexota bacterium]
MWSRRLDLISVVVLLAVLATTALSGLLADYLGVPRSLYHRLSAYSLVLMALLHVWLRRRQLWRRIGAEVGRHQGPVSRPERVPNTPREQPHPATPSRRMLLISGVGAAAAFVLGRWWQPGKVPSELVGTDPGLSYHQRSKPDLWGIVQRPFQWGELPPLYKYYPSARRIRLPGESGYRGIPVEEAIRRRRSIRDYSGDPMTMEQLSLLLHSASGITEPAYPLRASPSAGALYPVETYPVVNSVTGLATGVYHYRPGDHSLELIREGDFRSDLLKYTGGQDMVLQASVVLVLTAVFQRTRWKYQERAYRYVLLDAGHLGENLYLAATSLGLGPCGIGAFFDDEMNRLVGVDGDEEAAVYLVSIGRLG